MVRWKRVSGAKFSVTLCRNQTSAFFFLWLQPIPALTMHQLLSPADFKNPAILLSGQVNEAMYHSFREQLDGAPDQGLITVEITTLGGDPEVARMMGEDILFIPAGMAGGILSSWARRLCIPPGPH